LLVPLGKEKMKMIGKPYVGELQYLDEGGTGLGFTVDSKRARNWKRWIQPRIYLPND
jgi:hypothetical protein